MGFPHAKIGLEDSTNVTILHDTGIKINIITCEVIEDVGLAMRRSFKLGLASHIDYSCLFLNLYEDVEVAIRGLKTKQPIFVVKHGDHKLGLGLLFLNLVKFN